MRSQLVLSAVTLLLLLTASSASFVQAQSQQLVFGSFVISGTSNAMTGGNLDQPGFQTLLKTTLLSWLGGASVVEEISDVTIAEDASASSIAISFTAKTATSNGSSVSGDTITAMQTQIQNGGDTVEASIKDNLAASATGNPSTANTNLIWNQCNSSLYSTTTITGNPNYVGGPASTSSANCLSSITLTLYSSIPMTGKSSELCSALYSGLEDSITMCTNFVTFTPLTSEYGLQKTDMVASTSQVFDFTARFMNAARTGGLPFGIRQVTVGDATLFSTGRRIEGETKEISCADKMKWLAFLILLLPLYLICARKVYNTGKNKGVEKAKEIAASQQEQLLRWQRLGAAAQQPQVMAHIPQGGGGMPPHLNNGGMQGGYAQPQNQGYAGAGGAAGGGYNPQQQQQQQQYYDPNQGYNYNYGAGGGENGGQWNQAAEGGQGGY